VIKRRLIGFVTGGLLLLQVDRRASVIYQKTYVEKVNIFIGGFTEGNGNTI
jgi:hypothetical protein